MAIVLVSLAIGLPARYLAAQVNKLVISLK
jgi:hypothetical protein